MISSKVIMADYNANEVGLVLGDSESSGSVTNKDNRVSQSQTPESELFPELNELFINPDKFLSPSIIDHCDVMDFQDSSDRELLNYFTAPVAGGDLDQDDVVNLDGWSSDESREQIDGDRTSNTMKGEKGEIDLLHVPFENVSSNIVTDANSLDKTPSFRQTPPLIRMKRDLTKPVSVVLEKINIKVAKPEVTESKILHDFIQRRDPKMKARTLTDTDEENYKNNDDEAEIHKQEEWPNSPTSDQPVTMSRSALAARENRQRKKKYIHGLEESVGSLTKENKSLNKQLSCMSQQLGELKREVEYLSSVIANQSALSSLLNNVCSTPGVKFVGSGLFSGSNEKNMISAKEEVDETPPSKKRCFEDLRRPSTPCATGKEIKAGGNSSPSPRTRLHMRRVQKHDHDYASGSDDKKFSVKSNGRVPSREEAGKTSDAGVCLHVSNNAVSLEFCSKCNTNRASRRK